VVLWCISVHVGMDIHKAKSAPSLIHPILNCHEKDILSTHPSQLSLPLCLSHILTDTDTDTHTLLSFLPSLGSISRTEPPFLWGVCDPITNQDAPLSLSFMFCDLISSCSFWYFMLLPRLLILVWFGQICMLRVSLFDESM